MRISDAEDFFSSKAFKGFETSRENNVKLQLAVISRLDAVIKSFQALAKRP